MRRCLLAAALTAVCLLSAACAPRDAGPAPVSTTRVGGASGTELAAVQILRRGNGTEPESLDPHRAEGVTAANVLRDLFEGLVTEAPDGTLIPGAAESWTVSADGLVYTFRLQADGRWSNGDPVTAEDFVYGLRRSADPATLSEYSAILYPLENAAEVVAGTLPPDRLGVRAIDAQTLELRLHSPTPYLLGLLTHASTYPVHRQSVEQHGARFARPGNLVSNGPFRLGEWVVQSHIRLLRNTYYRDDAHTTLDEVWYYPVDNAEAELNRYRAGQFDMTETVPARQIPWLRQNLPDELHIAPYLGSYVFGFNTTQPPFRDAPKLRKALALALDREILTSKISGAGELPAYSWVPPVSGYTQQLPDWARWTQAERNAEAQRLYSSAGYSASRPLRMQLLYNTEGNHRRLAVAMAAMWREVLGVETELLNQEWQVFLQTRRSRIDTQLFRYGWIGDYNDPYTFAEILESRHGLNDMGYSNPRYDALLAAAAREADPVRRMDTLAEAERVMLEDMPIIPLYFYVSKKMVKPWVAGLEPNIMDHHHSRHLRILKH
ncbi:MAG: peptide ABC transporter substrate-binding protein [Gammaproteobacteria bacterium]|jgi:oligopeptide transport system substrate-binding protein|nr:peptide ABC transporter substrate-binding protein [Gammaproteobacteria bacterium]